MVLAIGQRPPLALLRVEHVLDLLEMAHRLPKETTVKRMESDQPMRFHNWAELILALRRLNHFLGQGQGIAYFALNHVVGRNSGQRLKDVNAFPTR